MNAFICATCGTQFPPSTQAPGECPICLDERQYVGLAGQSWLTMEELGRDRRNRIEEMEPGLFGIASEPSFAIGQRAALIRTDEGNLLWECVSLLDDETRRRVHELGGIRAIAFSHPHFYSSMVDWADEFDAAILIPEVDREQVMRPSDRMDFWSGERLELFGGLSVFRCGGHFPGSSFLHWPEGAGGRGAILTGDTIMVVPDRRWVSFMYSYPNLIPLPARQVRRIVEATRQVEFDRIYSSWWDRVVDSGGKDAVERSMERYLAQIAG